MSDPHEQPSEPNNSQRAPRTALPTPYGVDSESSIPPAATPIDPPKFVNHAPAETVEPPVVIPKHLRHHELDPFSEITSWIEDTLGSESYGAPRVFDLYTLLAVTLAFAIMFALLRLIEPLLLDTLPIVAISLGVFVTLTAIAQIVLWHGKKPRIASLVVGPPLWFLIAFIIGMQNPRALLNPVVFLGVLCSSVLGLFAGYLGGAMVAGVFLLADTFRKHFVKTDEQLALPQNDDAIWNSEE